MEAGEGEDVTVSCVVDAVGEGKDDGGTEGSGVELLGEGSGVVEAGDITSSV